jgi:hypothetical protein
MAATFFARVRNRTRPRLAPRGISSTNEAIIGGTGFG